MSCPLALPCLQSDSSTLNKAFKTKGCKLSSFTVKKLCVQQVGSMERCREEGHGQRDCAHWEGWRCGGA